VPTDLPLRRGAVKRSRKPTRKPRPTGVFGGLTPATAPLHRAQRVQHQRVQRAQSRLPARPVPRVPVLEHYTPRQQAVARHLIKRSVHQQAGGARRTPQRVAQVNQELMADPRTRQALYGALLAAATPRHRAAMIRAQNLRDVVKPLGTTARHDHKVSYQGATITVNPHAWLGALLDVAHTRSAVAEAGQVGKGVGKWVSPVTSDLKALAEGTFVGGYQLGAGAVDALSGRGTDRLGRLGSGVVKGLEESSPAALLTGHPGLALKRLGQHPIIELLNYAGLEGAVGRLGGAATRAAGSTVESAGVRGALARAGSTTRSPLALTDQSGSRIIHERKPYSKDLFRKGAQVLSDKTRTEAGFRVERNGRQVPVLKAHTGEAPFRSEQQRLLDRRTDFTASRANSVNRLVRERTARDVRRLSPSYRSLTRKADREIVPFALEGTIRTPATALKDLVAHRDRIAAKIKQAEHDIANAKPGTSKQEIYRHKTEIAAARERIATIDRFLKSKPTPERLAAIFRSRGEIGARLNGNDLRMGQQGLGNLHQAPPLPAVPVRAGAHGRGPHDRRGRGRRAAPPGRRFCPTRRSSSTCAPRASTRTTSRTCRTAPTCVELAPSTASSAAATARP
jgi:hypothetical protein